MDYRLGPGSSYRLLSTREKSRQRLSKLEAAAEQAQARALERVTERARFHEALQHQLADRVGVRGATLLPLCSCGNRCDPLNAAYPLHCANNCPLYRNPKAYAAALQQVLRVAGVAID